MPYVRISWTVDIGMSEYYPYRIEIEFLMRFGISIYLM